MKKINLLKPMLFAFLAFATLSCDDDDPAPTPQSISDIVDANPNFSTLETALERTGLDAVLDASGTFTVFAPTNAAFQTFFTSLGPNVTVANVNVDALRNILLNHVVGTVVQASNLTTGYGLKTLARFGGTTDGNNLNMYVNVGANSSVRLNGVSSVTTANVAASNGIIHIVDAVIGLPTVVTFAVADPTFDLLQAALTRDGDNLTDFVAVLSGTGPFTVFAPTNDAFTSLLADDLGGIGLAAIPEPTLDAVLKYHVASGNLLSSILTSPGDTPITSIQGSGFTITLPGTGGNIANITANGGRTSGIIAVDVQAANGVIHVINKVLLP